jgi:heme-degrading monooxygenase HmoA
MHIQIVNFETSLSETEVLKTCNERIENFRAIPGLIQKHYARSVEPNRYSGVYFWESKEAMQEFQQSELAASIPSAYKVVGKPRVDILEEVMVLRG